MEHQTFLRIIEKSDHQLFIEWYDALSNKENANVKEAIDRLSQKELNGIWTVLQKWVFENCDALRENPAVSEKQKIFHILQVMGTLALYSLDNLSGTTKPQGIFLSIQRLNASLVHITCKKAGETICEVSEKYWKTHPDNEQSLSVNVIKWLLNQTSENKATAASVKHLWSKKTSLNKLDANNLETSGLLKMFILCTSNSKFVNVPEGRKIIACLFNFTPYIVQQLHQCVKKQLPISSLADCESYGDIYFRAWRTSTNEECRNEIEFAIQDLMLSGVVAIRKPLGALEEGINKIPMNKLLFHVLHAIHRQKKQRTVAFFIYKLYKPILWRYLEAANGFVRANALCLFFDSFPFETGEGTDEDESIRKKQWSVIQAALMDPVPLVRSIAVQGTCQMLANYWEIIPVNIIQDLITCMLRKLLYDSASSDVRASVVKGLITMLDSKQTHSLLEKMIPITSKVLHDVHEKVRSEYVNLLTRIQSLRVSKLWEVIDINHLVVRLSIDNSKSVCKRLVVLLAPFYNPKSQPEIVLQRCLRLVIDNRAASRKFYEYANCFMDFQQMAQLILIIWKFLRNFILKQLHKKKGAAQEDQNLPSGAKKARRNEPASNGEASESENDKEGVDVSSDSDHDNTMEGQEEFNSSSIIGLIDVICIILNGNKTKFKASPNVVFWENIKKRFNKSCSLFFRYFRNNEGLRSLIYLYGLLSSSSSPMMLSFVKSQLKSLNENATREDFGHLIDVLCNWGRGDGIFDFMFENVQSSLSSLEESSSDPQAQRGKKKRVSFEKLSSKPMLSLSCMSYLMQNSHNKKIVLRQNLDLVEEFCSFLKPVLSVIERNPEKLTGENDFLYHSAVIDVKIILILASAFKREGDAQVKSSEYQEKIIDVLDWIKRLLMIENQTAALENLYFTFLSSINNLLIVHSIEYAAGLQFLSVVNTFLEKFSSSKNANLGLKTAHHFLEFILIQRSIGNEIDAQCDTQIVNLTKLVLEQCSSLSRKEPFADEDVNPMRDTIREIFTVCLRFKSPNQTIVCDIVKICVGIMRSELVDLAKKNEEINLAVLKDFPQTTAAIVGAFRSRNPLANMVLSELFESESSDQENELALTRMYGIVQLLQALSVDQGRISTATFVQSVSSADTIWSELGEIEKSLHPTLTTSINNLLKDLKKLFKIL